MYIAAVDQLFQYPSAIKSPTVASIGPADGSTILKYIRKSFAPSIFADSTNDCGIFDVKYDLIMIIYITGSNVPINNTVNVFLSPSVHINI